MKIKFILLSFLLLLSSCKNEIKTQKYPNDKNKNEVEKYCFLKDVVLRKGEIKASIDFIDKEPKSRAKEYSYDIQIIELPNDVCYVNKKVDLLEYRLADSVQIVMQTFSHSTEGNFNFNQLITPIKLVNFFSKIESERITFMPFYVTIANNEITSLKEIYIP